MSTWTRLIWAARGARTPTPWSICSTSPMASPPFKLTTTEPWRLIRTSDQLLIRTSTSGYGYFFEFEYCFVDNANVFVCPSIHLCSDEKLRNPEAEACCGHLGRWLWQISRWLHGGGGAHNGLYLLTQQQCALLDKVWHDWVCILWETWQKCGDQSEAPGEGWPRQ